MIRMDFDHSGYGKDMELKEVNPVEVWWQGCFFLCARDSELRPFAEIRERVDKAKYLHKKREWEQKRDLAYTKAQIAPKISCAYTPNHSGNTVFTLVTAMRNKYKVRIIGGGRGGTLITQGLK